MEIVLLLILTGLLSVIMFFSLKKLIESLNKDSQKYYFKTMQALDKKIEEKNKETNEEKINNEFYEEDKKKVEVKEGIDKSLLDIYNNADYENGNALKIANKVDAIFKIDEDKIISDFVKNNTVDENYKYYQSIYDRFSPNLIYKLKMLNKDNQINEISKMLNEDEYISFAYQNKKGRYYSEKNPYANDRWYYIIYRNRKWTHSIFCKYNFKTNGG